MIVAETRAQLHEALGHDSSTARAGAGRITLVPTMGALHSGHGRLLEVAAQRRGVLVVSIFVNPLQFAAGEDLARYPRSLDADLALSRERGVDVVFAPSYAEMYPSGDPQVSVDPGPLGSILEGASRPGHFRGVLTVVAKLLGLVRPDTAVFGEKDYQQLVLVSCLVDDLCLPVEVVAAPTVRADDGLALSSRNRYLDESQQRAAAALSRALSAGRAAGTAGPRAVLAAAREVLRLEPAVAVDYLSLRSPELGETTPPGPARLLVAATVGATRLIDNVAVELGAEAGTQPEVSP
ncbi:MAG: pantoate--beta-alanine ligase [Nocardioidaceae bacterium]|nr:pantoate--beta-alanine ligase [Nocardioidaceae bacterium]